MAFKEQGKKPRRLDRRNPFPWGGYLYGYFSAFLAGGGSTTREKLLARCIRSQEACGITVDPARIRKSIRDHIHHWKKGNQKGYILTVTEADKVLTCTMVGDVPWDRFLEGKVR